MRNPLLVILLGPTAVGKTAVALALAKKFRTSIVSADSRQLYREIPVGTAQPSEEELNSVPHFFIASHSVQEQVDAGRYGREARAVLANEFAKHNVVIMAGGSGLYIDAVINGFDELPEQDAALREELQKIYEEQGITPLQETLEKLDPEYFAQVDKSNPARVIRAIEVCRLSGKKYSELRKGKTDTLPFNVLKIGLDLPREELYDRINRRVDQMMVAGLEEEARAMFPHRSLNALRTVGYRELFDYFEGKISKEKAIDLVKQHSRNYAKRQLTWWRRDKTIKWFRPDEVQKMEGLIDLMIG